MAVKFTIKETRWRGCRYQSVQPDTVYSLPNWQGWMAWCVESFGPAGDVWSANSHRWYANSGKLFFRRSADLTAFLLRWA